MDDYYSGDSAADSKSPAAKTALLPRSMLGDCKPGDTVTLRVARVIDDEVEVAKVEKTKEESEAPEMPRSAMMDAEDEMEGMMA